MKSRNIKTIDVNASEWFDKMNGNSYFSMNVTINYGLKNESTFYVPMQYGYGIQYKHEAFKEIQKRYNTFKSAGANDSYFNTYNKYGIITRHNKQTNCRKRDL